MKMNNRKMLERLQYGIEGALYLLPFYNTLTPDDIEYWIWQFMRRGKEYREDIDRCYRSLVEELDKEFLEDIEGDIGAAVENSSKRDKWFNYFKNKYGLEKPHNYNWKTIWREHFYPAIEVLPEKTDKSLREIVTRKNKRGKLVRVINKMSFRINLLYDNKTLLNQFEKHISYIKSHNYSRYKSLPPPSKKEVLRAFYEAAPPENETRQNKINQVIQKYDDVFRLEEHKVTESQKQTYEQDIAVWDVREYLVNERLSNLANGISRRADIRKRILNEIKISAIQDLINNGKTITGECEGDKYEHILFAKRPLSRKCVESSLNRMKQKIEKGGYKKMYTK